MKTFLLLSNLILSSIAWAGGDNEHHQEVKVTLGSSQSRTSSASNVYNGATSAINNGIGSFFGSAQVNTSQQEQSIHEVEAKKAETRRTFEALRNSLLASSTDAACKEANAEFQKNAFEVLKRKIENRKSQTLQAANKFLDDEMRDFFSPEQVFQLTDSVRAWNGCFPEREVKLIDEVRQYKDAQVLYQSVIPLNQESEGVNYQELYEFSGQLFKAGFSNLHEAQINIRDEAAFNEHLEASHTTLELGKTFLDIAIGLNPVSGFAQSSYELLMGKNLVTGAELTRLERSFAFFGVITAGTGTIAAKASNLILKLAQRTAHGFGPKAFRGSHEAIEYGRRLIQLAPEIEKTAGELRKAPGVGVINEGLHDAPQMMRGTHANAGLVPREIGEKLAGREFRNFDHFRREFWKAVGESKYAGEFLETDRMGMLKGFAPVSHPSQHRKSLRAYELHHIQPINQGGSVYDVSNIMIVTPKFHREVLLKEFHYGN